MTNVLNSSCCKLFLTKVAGQVFTRTASSMHHSCHELCSENLGIYKKKKNNPTSAFILASVFKKLMAYSVKIPTNPPFNKILKRLK